MEAALDVHNYEGCQGKSPVAVIMERTQKSKASMQKLVEDISLLDRKQPLPAFKLLLGSRSLLEALRDTHKRARNLGEDLIEEQLALDMLEGLSDADRALRKKAIAEIDETLDKVDKAKARCDALLKTAAETDEWTLLKTSAETDWPSGESRQPAVEEMGPVSIDSRPLKLKVELDGDIRRNQLVFQDRRPTVKDVRQAVGQLYGMEPASIDGLDLKFRDSAGTRHTLADDTLGKALAAEAPKRLLRLTASRL